MAAGGEREARCVAASGTVGMLGAAGMLSAGGGRTAELAQVGHGGLFREGRFGHGIECGKMDVGAQAFHNDDTVVG